MKKFAAFFLSVALLLSFASCKGADKSDKKDSGANNTTVSAQKGEDSKDKTADKASQDGEKATTVDYSKVIKKLNRKEKALVDKLGKTEKGKKIVAFFGDEFETQFIVVDFKNGKVSSVKNYRFFKDESKYTAYSMLAEKLPHDFTDHKEEKCVEQNQTKMYINKTYDDMEKLLHGYDHM